MSDEIVFLVEKLHNGNYIAKSVEYSLLTEARTLEELRIMIKDAIDCNFEPKNRPQLICLSSVLQDFMAKIYYKDL